MNCESLREQDESGFRESRYRIWRGVAGRLENLPTIVKQGI